MALFYKVNNTWKKCDIHYKNSTGWKEVKNIYHKVGTTWKPIWNYFWETGAWGTCSAPCGGGTQTRISTCKRSDGFYKADSFCLDYSSKPITSQVCNTQACLTVTTNTNSNCSFTCTTNVMCGSASYKVRNVHQYFNLGTFTLSNPNRRDVYWKFIFRVYDVAIWVKMAIASSIVGITDVPMVCADYAPKSWKPPRIQVFSAYYCELGFPNEQRNGTVWIIARIPGHLIGPDGRITGYLYSGDRRRYSGSTLYFHDNTHAPSLSRCSQACVA